MLYQLKNCGLKVNLNTLPFGEGRLRSQRYALHNSEIWM